MTSPWAVSFDDSQATGQKTPSKFRDELEALYASFGGEGLTPESFGALGNGVSDDTTAMQAWLDEVQSGYKYGALTPGKTYLISDSLIVNTVAANWIIDGRGAEIRQNTDGKHIFHFTVENVRSWQMRNMVWRWTNSQDYVDNSAGIQFECTTDAVLGWFNFLIQNISLYNAYQGFRTVDNSGHINVVWNCVFDRVAANYGCTGSLLKFANGLAGQTGITIRDAYQHRETSSEPVVRIIVADALQLNVKIDGENQTAHRSIELEYVNGAVISGRQERGNLAEGEHIIWLHNCLGITVEAFSIQAIQSYTGTRQYGIYLENTQGFSHQGVAVTYYSPNPAPPDTFAVVGWDSASTFANSGLQGAATDVYPALAATGISDNSVGPAKLVNGGTVPSATTYYRGDGSWQTITTGGGSATPAIRKQSIMALGDSLSAVVSAYSTSLAVDTHLGAAGHGPGDYLFLANTLEGSPLDVLGSAATAGYTVQQIRDTHLPTILSAKPEYCICYSLGANNMLASGEFASSTIDVSVYILNTLMSNGITPILATIVPAVNATNAGLSHSEIDRYNIWAANFAAKKGLPLLDFYTALVDPATGTYKAGYTSDNTHPNAVGAAAQAQVTRELVKKLTLRQAANSWPLAGHNGTVTGRASNPLLAGTIGANSPTGWSVSNATPELAASASYLGNEFQITATASFGYAMAPVLSGAAGNEWDLTFRWSTTPAAGGGWGMALYDQSGNIAHMWGASNAANPTQLSLASPFHARGKFVSGDTSLQAMLFLYGGGSVAKFAQFTFRNLSAMSIPLA